MGTTGRPSGSLERLRPTSEWKAEGAGIFRSCDGRPRIVDRQACSGGGVTSDAGPDLPGKRGGDEPGQDSLLPHVRSSPPAGGLRLRPRRLEAAPALVRDEARAPAHQLAEEGPEDPPANRGECGGHSLAQRTPPRPQAGRGGKRYGRGPDRYRAPRASRHVRGASRIAKAKRLEALIAQAPQKAALTHRRTMELSRRHLGSDPGLGRVLPRHRRLRPGVPGRSARPKFHDWIK